MSQLQTEHTFADLLNPSDDKLYELVRGQLVEKNMAVLSVFVASQICYLLMRYLESARKGWAMTEVPINCFGWLRNHGRRPDVAYFHFDRLPELTNDAVTVAPNLVVEVLSPNDDAIDLDIKIEEYFRAGVEVVWVVNPETKTVRTCLPDGSGHLFHESDLVTGDPVLPEFAATVRDFFPKPRP